MDPLVQHTIQLLQHARRLRVLINNIQQHQQQSEVRPNVQLYLCVSWLNSGFIYASHEM